MKFTLYLLSIVTVFHVGCTKDPQPDQVDPVSITSIAPSSGSSGTTVVIKGSHFGTSTSDNTVRFNGDSAVVLSSAVDSLVVVAPANGKSGPVTVAVAGNTAAGPVFTYTTDSVDVYVTAPAFGVAYWKNGQQVFVAPTQLNTGGAYGIAVADTNVYVGGYTFFSTFPTTQAAYWKNGVKTTLSKPDSAGEARAFLLSGSDIYAGGIENRTPLYWKNGVRYPLPTFGREYARVNALAVSGNDVYAAGFEPGPGNEQNAVYWKNGVETLLGKNGIVSIGATSIAVNGTDVYVCATDSGSAVYWKNGVRITLDKSLGDGSIRASAIAIAGNSVYVVGTYRGDAVYWKDGTRVTLPKRSLYAGASTITFYQSDVYIGGGDGSTTVYWKNGVEVPLCCTQGGDVTAIVVVRRR